MSLYRLGVEEEHFVTGLHRRNVLRSMSKKFFSRMQGPVGRQRKNRKSRQSPRPAKSLADARGSLSNSRTTIATVAEEYGLGIVTSGTHPLASWPEQKATRTPHYDAVMAELQVLGRRNMLCGCMSTSKSLNPTCGSNSCIAPYPSCPSCWRSAPRLHSGGANPPGYWAIGSRPMMNYRGPGSPELFRRSEEYQCYVDTLAAAGIIPDASFMWWAIRPSLRYPTIELRIADACTRLEDALCIAAIIRCLIRHLREHPELNAEYNPIARAIRRKTGGAPSVTE